MQVTELLAALKARRNNLFQGPMNEAAAAELVRAAFDAVRRQVKATSEGVLEFEGLGVFEIKNVVRPRAEGDVKRKVVRFRLKAKAPGGGA